MVTKIIYKIFVLCFVFTSINKVCDAQNSILVNFGASSCLDSSPDFSLITNPLTDSSSKLISCSLASELPDVFAVFVAYNPKDNKLYVADIRSGINTKIWKVDIGLPENITCPLLDTLPDYSYNYISNNFEFDNNGNLWSLSKYNDSLGQCSIDNFDVTTGKVISTRFIQFPQESFPTTISSGDITILPNGRMFATLGSFPSKLYEINNYTTATNAMATYLIDLPLSCYGIAYLNGKLELTGTDFSGNCYYYTYDISNNTLDSAKSFQQGLFPIDNTSITPSVGVTKQLVNSTKVNENTADLTYEIYAKNLGNVGLNNINLSDNLAAVFGVQNISNVHVEFVPGNNEANLLLNDLYNGITDTSLLAGAENLPNQIGNNQNYFVKLRLSFRVSNLNPAIIYKNSAIGTASIGSVGTLSFTNVADSSNNGPETAVDPNNDGNATEPGENAPTPFNFGTLPVKFISINAKLLNKSSSIIKWNIATPSVHTDKFEVQYSMDESSWNTITVIDITNVNQSDYSFTHNNIPAGNLYYRIKETDADGNFVYSTIFLLKNIYSQEFIIYPNPASSFIKITSPSNSDGNTKISLFNAVGQKVLSHIITDYTENINIASLVDGTYILKIETSTDLITKKITIQH